MQFAQGLSRALRQMGADARLFFRGETPERMPGPNVVLRIVGPHLEEPVQAMPNMVWMITPPHNRTAGLLRRYQRIFTPSRRMMDALRAEGIAAQHMPQVTEVEHFHPDRRRAGLPDLPITFVGAHAPRAPRRIVLSAIEQGFRVHVWGPGWKDVIPSALWIGDHLDYDALAEVYARSRIVLNAHMPEMAMQGIMSNRAYDAIASGAVVVSDVLRYFTPPPDLPELMQSHPGRPLATLLEGLLDAPAADHATRLDRHRRIAAAHGFGAVAARILAAAAEIPDDRPAPAFRRRGDGRAGPVELTDPAASAPDQQQAMRQAAEQILAIADALGHPQRDGFVAGRAGPCRIIHPLMADLRLAQDAARRDPPGPPALIDALAARARRVIDALPAEGRPHPVLRKANTRDAHLTAMMRDEPLYAHSAEDYSRDIHKSHLRLWPRRDAVRLARPVGVFLHLFYDELAVLFRDRLAQVDAPMQLYVSTDTEAKAQGLRAVFPEADVRAMPNRGRDILPKFYGFDGAHDRHDIVLHLHGKRSAHSGRLDAWLAHILDCLLPCPSQINRILSLFRTIPELGLIAPLTHKAVLPAAHWGANQDIARELAHRMGLTAPLPEDDRLRFPVGSMFWARRSALQPLLDLGLGPDHFPPEAGQLDGTLAHAIERMVGCTCMATGHRMLNVARHDSRQHQRFQHGFDSNQQIRAALTSGRLDGMARASTEVAADD